MERDTGSREKLRLTSALPEWSGQAPSCGERVIGVLPGEGIGPEVVGVALKVLKVVAHCVPHSNLRAVTGGEIGVPAQRASGRALSDQIISFCEEIFAQHGAVFCGPGGGRFVYETRQKFDLYCKFTPLCPVPALADTGALSSAARSGVDIVMVRENTGGTYLGAWGTRHDSGVETAYQDSEYRRDHVERILAAAFNLAALRRGRLCVTLKPGGVPAISALWERVMREMNQARGMHATVLEVDNAGYQLVASGRDFDVVVSPNMYGDILADLASLHLASRGMSFSGNFGPGRRAFYQTAHGAAHDLVGTDRANPIGQILSLAMMLRESFALGFAADSIEHTVQDVLRAGWRTADIAAAGSRVIGTQQMGDVIVAALEQRMRAVA